MSFSPSSSSTSKIQKYHHHYNRENLSWRFRASVRFVLFSFFFILRKKKLHFQFFFLNHHHCNWNYMFCLYVRVEKNFRTQNANETLKTKNRKKNFVKMVKYLLLPSFKQWHELLVNIVGLYYFIYLHYIFVLFFFFFLLPTLIRPRSNASISLCNGGVDDDGISDSFDSFIPFRI